MYQSIQYIPQNTYNEHTRINWTNPRKVAFICGLRERLETGKVGSTIFPGTEALLGNIIRVCAPNRMQIEPLNCLFGLGFVPCYIIGNYSITLLHCDWMSGWSDNWLPFHWYWCPYCYAILGTIIQHLNLSRLMLSGCPLNCCSWFDIKSVEFNFAINFPTNEPPTTTEQLALRRQQLMTIQISKWQIAQNDWEDLLVVVTQWNL